MTKQPLLIVVLAAGKGVRMRSSVPKVLHAIAGRSMLAHALATARAAGPTRSPWWWRPAWRRCAPRPRRIAPGIEVFEQATQAGTGNALLAARPALERHKGDVIVLFADTPLVEPATLRRLVAALDAGAGIAALGFEAPDATGYGRLLLDAQGRVTAIREHKDASEEERRIGLCNAGVMAFRVPDLAEPAGAHRQQQRQGRILSHRCGGDRGRRRTRARCRSAVRRRRRWASTRASSSPPPRPCSRAAPGARSWRRGRRWWRPRRCG